MGQNNLISIDLSMLIQMINFFIMVFVFWKFFGKKIYIIWQSAYFI